MAVFARTRIAGGAILGLAALLAGCALNNPPSSQALQQATLAHARSPAAWIAQGAGAGQVQDGWVANFGDAQLLERVNEALTHNPDLQIAAARVEQAAAYVRIAGGALYPAVSALGFTNTKEKNSASTDLRGWRVNASWEVDLWGRVRYGARAAEQQYASAEADANYARQSLAAMVARAWFMATEASLQRGLAADTVDSAARLLQLAEVRQRIGVGSELEVTQARASLRTTEDAARQIALALEQSLRALELLLGRYPAADIAIAAQLSTLTPPAPAGLPSELLERRPDVIAAERRVAAAFDLVGEAQAARLPRLSLSAGMADLTSDLFVLQGDGGIGRSLGANLLAPLFQGGALQAQVELRSAEQKEAMAAWAQTGLRAFGEVENALSAEAALHEREALLTQAVSNHARALELEEIRYRLGSRDLRSVTQQQLTLYNARMQLLRVQSEQRVQRVNLHLALGGGFALPAMAPGS